jgi:WD40 repeat protein
VLLVALLLVTAFSGFTAWVGSREQLREQAALAVDSQVASHLRTDKYLAGQLALAAYRLYPSPRTEGRLLQFGAEERAVSGPTAVDAKATLMASAAPNGDINLKELDWGTAIIPGTGAAVDSLALSDDAKLLAASYDDGSLALFDVSVPHAPVRKWLRHGNRVLVSFDHTGHTLAAAGHPADDVKLAPAATDTTLWNVTDPAKPVAVATLTDALGPAHFSAAGLTLTTVPSRGDVRRPQVWLRGQDRWDPLPTDDDQHDNYVAESVSEDGALVTVVSADLTDPATVLWQLRPGRLVRIITLSTAPAAVAPAFDWHTVAVVEADGAISVWTVDDGGSPNKTAELTGAPDHVRTVSFTADGNLVAIGDTTLTTWTMRPDAAAAAACRLPRTGLISQSQWDSYFPGMDVPMPCEDPHG